MRLGYSLVELAAVVAVLAVLAAAVGPPARALGDRLAVVGARESVAGLIAEARAAGLGRGGARIRVEGAPWRAWSEVDGRFLRTVAIEADFRTTVVLSRARTGTLLFYDALGLGRLSNETLRFRRGGEETALVVSGYGRVRRR